MNILILTSDLTYGGPARQASLLAAALPRERFAVHLFTLRPDAPWSRELREAGVAVESGNRRRLFDVQPLLALRRALRDPAPDVVHVFGLPALRALALAGGRHTARVMAIAVHPYISGVPHRIKYFERIYAYMKKRPGVLFCKGEDILDWYRSLAGRGKRSE